MPRTLRIAALLLLPLLLSCARSIRSPLPVDADHEALRLRYLEEYPDEPFRESILRQELRKGMSPTEVFLAWGRPVHRFKGEDHQNWIYEFMDAGADESQPRTVARLYFKGDKLVRWRRDRQFVYFSEPESEGDFPAEPQDLPTKASPKTRAP